MILKSRKVSETAMDAKLLLQALKRVLKEKKIKYADLANRLSVSEVSIKRIFSNSNCSLERLEQICSCINISIIDLLKWVEEQPQEVFSITWEQEELLAKDLQLFDFWMDLHYEQASLSKLRKKFKLTVVQQNKYLKILEGMNLIERHPYDRIKSKVRGTLNLLENGPLQRARTLPEIINFVKSLGNKTSKDRLLTMSHRRVSPESLLFIRQRIEEVFHEFRLKAQRDEKILSNEDLIRVCWLGGVSPMKLN